MKVEHIKSNKFNFIKFENIFNQKELDLIWKECLFLCDEEKLLIPEESGSAVDDYGRLLKQNKAIFLEELYINRETSNYIKLYKKPITENDALIQDFMQEDFNLQLFRATNMDKTLINYYEDFDYYSPHRDNSCYTYVFWLFKEPKKFTGGNLIFDDIDYEVDVKSNSAVLFPSWASHSVQEIRMNENIKPFTAQGRFSFSTFFNFRS